MRRQQLQLGFAQKRRRFAELLHVEARHGGSWSPAVQSDSSGDETELRVRLRPQVRGCMCAFVCVPLALPLFACVRLSV